jgi:four helix bundle protein
MAGTAATNIRSYRDLKVWQQAMELIPNVYESIRKLPKEENYALADQIRRAAVSIPANIAEGHGRAHRREYIQFLSIARGSLAELATLLEIAHRLGYLTSDDLDPLMHKSDNLGRPLNALIASLRAKSLP